MSTKTFFVEKIYNNTRIAVLNGSMVVEVFFIFRGFEPNDYRRDDSCKKLGIQKKVYSSDNNLVAIANILLQEKNFIRR